MERFVNVYPMLESETISFSKIRKYLKSEKYESRGRDGKYVFARKATRFVQLTYMDEMLRLEAWVEGKNAEQEYQALKQQVIQVEKILLCEDEEENDALPQMPEGVRVSKQEYLRKYAGEEFDGNLKMLGILGYVMLIPIVVSAFSNPVVLLDGAILLALTFGMHLGRNKLCAIGIALYSLISCVLSMGGGMLTLWGWVILGVFAFLQFQKAEKQYEKLMRDRRNAAE